RFLYRSSRPACFLFFFWTATSAPAIYTLSLHDALPIWLRERQHDRPPDPEVVRAVDAGSVGEVVRDTAEELPQQEDVERVAPQQDRKSTRLNSSHVKISYAVFCLKKKMN